MARDDRVVTRRTLALHREKILVARSIPDDRYLSEASWSSCCSSLPMVLSTTSQASGEQNDDIGVVLIDVFGPQGGPIAAATTVCSPTLLGNNGAAACCKTAEPPEGVQGDVVTPGKVQPPLELGSIQAVTPEGLLDEVVGDDSDGERHREARVQNSEAAPARCAGRSAIGRPASGRGSARKRSARRSAAAGM